MEKEMPLTSKIPKSSRICIPRMAFVVFFKSKYWTLFPYADYRKTSRDKKNNTYIYLKVVFQMYKHAFFFI